MGWMILKVEPLKCDNCQEFYYGVSSNVTEQGSGVDKDYCDRCVDEALDRGEVVLKNVTE